MSILINSSTRVIVQGITGRDGQFHAQRMKDYGTLVVGGTSPGKGGTTIAGIPVFNTMKQAVETTHADASIIFIPARWAADAIMEAVDAGIRLIICISEGIPTQDVIRARRFAEARGAMLIGPNCPGMIVPGDSMIGIMPAHIFKPVEIGKNGGTAVISRSGTLTYEVVSLLSAAGISQSVAIGVGGDPVAGLYFIELLEMLQADEKTDSIVLIGEIGGDAEELAAEYIGKNLTKPVVAFIAGQAAPEGKQMGHAGAIISGSKGTAAEKIRALEAVGVKVARRPSEIPGLI